MKNETRHKAGWIRAALAVLVGSSLCTVLALTACSGTAEQPSATDTSEEAASETPAPESDSSAASSKTSTAPSEAYVYDTFTINGSDGSTMTDTFTFDERGQQLAESQEQTSSELSYKADTSTTEWDEFGHAVKKESTYEYADGGSGATKVETTVLDTNEDGTLASVTSTYTYEQEDFGDDDVASQKVTETMEYGSDTQIFRTYEVVLEYYNKSGTLLATITRTNEYDEDGLQTRQSAKTVDADGAEYNQVADITWTKDADGKPTSYQVVLSQDGAETSTSTGNVTVDESGLISEIDDIEVDGEPLSTTVSISRTKISDPLPNAYEGWKTFALTDFILK